jgi:hypothetical protein
MLLLSWVIATSSMLAFTTPAAIAKRLVYHQQTGDEVTQYEIRIEPYDDGYRIYGYFDDRVTLVECDDTFGHQRFKVERRTQDNYIITYMREDETITGTLGANSIQRKVSDDPWYQTLEISKTFIESQDNNLGKFWFVSDQLGTLTKEDSLFSAFKLQAQKKGTEVIKHHGCDVETLKVLIRLTGLKAALWKAEYWYRPSDGIMLRYEAVRGGPGTPKTIITLLEEEELSP